MTALMPYADSVYLLADPTVQPTLGQAEWHMAVKQLKAWKSLQCPYVRRGTRISITVSADRNAAFYIRIQNT